MTADTYSATLGWLNQGTGNNNNSWGDNCDLSIFPVFERAIAGYATHAVTGGTLDLSTSPPPAAMRLDIDMIHAFTGVLASNEIMQIPNLSKMYLIRNACTGSFTLTVKTPSGSASSALTQGGWSVVWCDGANNVYVGNSTADFAKLAQYRADTGGGLVTGGGTTAYTLTTTQGMTALVAGAEVAFGCNATNTGTSTLAVDGLTAKPLRYAANSELAAGDIVIGSIYRAVYYTSNGGEWIIESRTILSPSQVGTSKIADDAVTLAKLVNASAQYKILARKTAAAGDWEECSITELLDFVGAGDGSSADGDILYRDTTWKSLPKGTNGQSLTIVANLPSWVTPIFTAEYTSADLTASVSTGATLTHGLGAIPKFVQLFLVCQSTDNGYAAGDVVPYGNTGATISSVSGISVTVTATTIVYKQSSNSLYLPNKSTGDAANLTMANWKLRFKAFA